MTQTELTANTTLNRHSIQGMVFGLAPWIVYWVLVGNVPFTTAVRSRWRSPLPRS